MDPDPRPCLKHGSIENEMNSTDRRERNMFSDITFCSQLTKLHATLENVTVIVCICIGKDA